MYTNTETHSFLTNCRNQNIDKLESEDYKDVSDFNKTLVFLSLFKLGAELDFIEYIRKRFLSEIKFDDTQLYSILYKSSIGGHTKYVKYIIENLINDSTRLNSMIKDNDFEILKKSYNKKKFHILDYLHSQNVFFP
jgi:hypothetical protein